MICKYYCDKKSIFEIVCVNHSLFVFEFSLQKLFF